MCNKKNTNCCIPYIGRNIGLGKGMHKALAHMP
jgi:hypothetical protein